MKNALVVYVNYIFAYIQICVIVLAYNSASIPAYRKTSIWGLNSIYIPILFALFSHFSTRIISFDNTSHSPYQIHWFFALLSA